MSIPSYQHAPHALYAEPNENFSQNSNIEQLTPKSLTHVDFTCLESYHCKCFFQWKRCTRHASYISYTRVPKTTPNHGCQSWSPYCGCLIEFWTPRKVRFVNSQNPLPPFSPGLGHPLHAKLEANQYRPLLHKTTEICSPTCKCMVSYRPCLPSITLVRYASHFRLDCQCEISLVTGGRYWQDSDRRGQSSDFKPARLLFSNTGLSEGIAEPAAPNQLVDRQNPHGRVHGMASPQNLNDELRNSTADTVEAMAAHLVELCSERDVSKENTGSSGGFNPATLLEKNGGISNSALDVEDSHKEPLNNDPRSTMAWELFKDSRYLPVPWRQPDQHTYSNSHQWHVANSQIQSHIVPINLCIPKSIPSTERPQFRQDMYNNGAGVRFPQANPSYATPKSWPNPGEQTPRSNNELKWPILETPSRIPWPETPKRFSEPTNGSNGALLEKRRPGSTNKPKPSTPSGRPLPTFSSPPSHSYYTGHLDSEAGTPSKGTVISRPRRPISGPEAPSQFTTPASRISAQGFGTNIPAEVVPEEEARAKIYSSPPSSFGGCQWTAVNARPVGT